MWGDRYPQFMDALMPLASPPTQIAGRNRIWRKMAMDAIRDDPAWMNGEYKEQPRQGLSGALHMILLAGSVPLDWQTTIAPTRDAADAYLASEMEKRLKTTDANDELYQLDSSRDYDPSTHLEQITAPLIAINSADDQVNPPELGIRRETDWPREAGALRADPDLATHARAQHPYLGRGLARRIREAARLPPPIARLVRPSPLALFLSCR